MANVQHNFSLHLARTPLRITPFMKNHLQILTLLAILVLVGQTQIASAIVPSAGAKIFACISPQVGEDQCGSCEDDNSCPPEDPGSE